ncbi:MAG: arginase [Candidatus Kapabacteria bacterium]|jgi:arginase|nr:arginase [Candidatus Kapabacteria bacterium]
MHKATRIRMMGFPIDLGADRRGVDMGPSALRIADIDKRLEALGYEVIDEGDIPIRNIEVSDIHDPRLKYLPEIAGMSTILASRVKAVLDDGDFPLVLGGDHSMSIGSLAGIGAHCKQHGKTLGVIWIDAHADMNTAETTPSGNIHGMPVAVALGHGHPTLTSLMGDFPKLDPSNLAIVGLRSIDAGERDLIRELGVAAYTMFDVDRLGMYHIASRVLEDMARRVDHLHISFDCDGVDPSIAPGVGTPVAGGLSFRETHLFMEMISEVDAFASLEVAEVNPILDERNKTAEFAADVVASSMGKRIL